MSDDPAFNGLIDTLLNSADGTARQKAAMALGQYVDELSDDEYAAAKQALNQALTDPDPAVINAVMQALAQYNRAPSFSGDDYELHGDAEADMLPEKGASCAVCGRPEPLIPDGGCERDDCPYG